MIIIREDTQYTEYTSGGCIDLYYIDKYMKINNKRNGEKKEYNRLYKRLFCRFYYINDIIHGICTVYYDKYYNPYNIVKKYYLLNEYVYGYLTTFSSNNNIKILVVYRVVPNLRPLTRS